MPNEHSDVGIATIVFYAPTVALAAHLILFRHGRPRQPWFFLFMFSLVRVASGVIAILYEHNSNNVGLQIAAIILLGVGVMPLIAVTIGLFRVILSLDFEEAFTLPKVVIFSRLLFLAGVIVLVVGGIFEGNYKSPSSVTLGLKLVKAGYIVVVITLAYLVAFEAYLWSQKRQLSRSSVVIFRGNACAVVFIMIRITYAMLSVFDASDLRWNNLRGSIGIFVTMALMPEYIAMLIFIGVGFMISPLRTRRPDCKQLQQRRGIIAARASEQQQRSLGSLSRLQQMWNERD